MLDLPLSSLLAENRPGKITSILSKLLKSAYTLAGRHKYDDFRLERILGTPIIVTPTVANPKFLRTGEFFASQLDKKMICADDEVLDLGTGSGVCALFAAQHARRVIGTDTNRAAVRCANLNVLMNGLDDRIELREGNLFDPVVGERFDLILFNPPFLSGMPEDARDAAWRCGDIPARFAAGLADRLKPGGAAFLVLSSFGDACAAFESELTSHGFRLEIFAQRRYFNELVIILKATPPTIQDPDS